METEKIPVETIQSLTSFQAWEYRLVPYGEHAGKLLCYGSEGVGKTEAVAELEVLAGKQIEVEEIAENDLVRLLQNYYRQAGKETKISPASASDNRFLMQLIEEAYLSYASDIHFEIYNDRCRVRLRCDGRLLERYLLERQHYPALINQIKILANLDISEKRLPQDGRIYYNNADHPFDLRVSCLPTIYGEKVVLRLLTRHVELLELGNLGFSPRQLKDYTAAVEKPYGLILISGPTGSGKSTTLYATLRQLNREQSNILTIEDPVEYTLEGVNQVQLKEEIGLTFGSALRTFLRQDPDIIMLGEIRDADTAQMALRSSLTGHLIFSTIHTNSAWGSIARMVDMGLHPYLISHTLVMCVAQRLVRLLCPACKRPSVPDDETLGQLGLSGVSGSFYGAAGCEACYYTGYKGRKAIYEVIPIDAELSEAIRRSQSDISAYMQRNKIVSLRESVLHLLLTGETSLDEIVPFLN